MESIKKTHLIFSNGFTFYVEINQYIFTSLERLPENDDVIDCLTCFIC